MAKVHKAHKSNKKYGFQRNKKKTIAWIVGIIAVIVAIVIGIVTYNNSCYGEVAVTAPAEASLTNIADNWQVLASHTDKITNEYLNAFGTESDESGFTLLTYNTDLVDAAQIVLKPMIGGWSYEVQGSFSRNSIFTAPMGDLFTGKVDLSTTTMNLQAGNEDVLVIVSILNPETKDDALLHAVIAELEAIIAEGPVVTEATEETAEASEETTEAAEETAEAAEETAEAAEETTEASEETESAE